MQDILNLNSNIISSYSYIKTTTPKRKKRTLRNISVYAFYGGINWARTSDPHDVNVVL